MTRRLVFLALAALWATACTTGEPMPMGDAGPQTPIVDGMFRCVSEDAVACLDNVHYSCARDGEFLSTRRDDCSARDDGRDLCLPELGCALCRPEQVFCAGGDVATCNADGTDFEVLEECDIEGGFVCDLGECKNLCEIAARERSYQGCEFFGVDLDNASLGVGSDASSQQYSIVVSNPGTQPTEVIVEINRAAVGEEPVIEEVERVSVLPGDLEILDLPRREVDGSSSFFPCEATSECAVGESCWCAGDTVIEDPPPGGAEEHRDCRCRNAAGSNGMNDGTHSALSSHAYRVRSALPIIAYQFNPLDNVGVFSNDASLLLPSSATGETYTVVGWPQTIADSDNPNEDFSPGEDDEDLRAFMTIVGSAPGTHVTVTLGPQVRRVVGIGDQPDGGPGDVWEFDIGPFDVVNLETQGFNADFTGTTVDATNPVAVFAGSEASDAPRFATLSNRQCCADHLEEQLFSNQTLGRHFFIGRMPPRSVALNDAFLDPSVDSVGEFNEPEYVRVVAVSSGVTEITTTLPPPDDRVALEQGESIILTALQDFEMDTSQSVAVLQVLPSQGAVGIPSEYPGGDPAIVAVPPVEQYRREYVFLTPNLYAFDFITITAERTTSILLDQTDIGRWMDEGKCTVGPADGIRRRDEDPPPEWVVYRCQFSFPDVIGQPDVEVEEGIQDDGYHTLLASDEVGIVIYGFDAYVSYAYAGGLNLQQLD